MVSVWCGGGGMNQLDRDIKYFEFCKKFLQNNGTLDRILSYLQELKLFRMREIMNVKYELNSVQAQMQLSKQLSKSELEAYNRLQTIRQLQDQSQIIRQGDK